MIARVVHSVFRVIFLQITVQKYGFYFKVRKPILHIESGGIWQTKKEYCFAAEPV